MRGVSRATEVLRWTTLTVKQVNKLAILYKQSIRRLWARVGNNSLVPIYRSTSLHTSSYECLCIMNSVYVPAHVALILRRIVNVISTLSISNQYLLSKRTQAEQHSIEDKQGEPSHRRPRSFGEGAVAASSWENFGVLKDVGWPAWTQRGPWDWPQFPTKRETQLTADYNNLIVKCVCVCCYL